MEWTCTPCTKHGPTIKYAKARKQLGTWRNRCCVARVGHTALTRGRRAGSMLSHTNKHEYRRQTRVSTWPQHGYKLQGIARSRVLEQRRHRPRSERRARITANGCGRVGQTCVAVRGTRRANDEGRERRHTARREGTIHSLRDERCECDCLRGCDSLQAYPPTLGSAESLPRRLIPNYLVPLCALH